MIETSSDGYVQGGELLNLVDNFYIKKQTKFRVLELDATDLNLVNRLDIFIKLQAIPSVQAGIKNDYSTSLYEKHIVAITDGTCKENGNKNKDGIQSYFKYFKSIISSIQLRGFDSDVSLIPVNNSLEPLNGAHRIAAALYFNKKIKCIVCDEGMVDYGFKYFSKLNFEKYSLYQAVSIMQKYQKDVLTGVVWPSSKVDVNKLFDNVVLEQELNLNTFGIKNFVINTYLNEGWLGIPEDNFLGAEGKSKPCTGLNQLKVFIFKVNNQNKVIDLKDKVRSGLGLGKHSVHICDDQNDSYALTKFALNPNIENILNTIENYKFPEYLKQIIYISKNKLQIKSKFILSGSSLLGLLSLREPNDIDYLAVNDLHYDNMDYHGDNNGHNSFSNIYQNPYSHFYYFDITFYSAQELVLFKRHRGEVKDFKDIDLIDGIIDDRRSKKAKLASKIKMNATLFKLVIINKLKLMLLRFGIFNSVKTVYYFFKNKLG
ncbi:hypothetical protein [Colwellia piezophila]|uniref:hypothetical protein n=1 Tax=Colwellia piezophila TaxID=211668 RepID=UPI0003617F87|nr:hypothetical protein [Colwellia piezophila]